MSTEAVVGSRYVLQRDCRNFFAVYHVRKKMSFLDHVQKKGEATACSSVKLVLCKLCHVIKNVN